MTYTDDITGEPADETVRFGLDQAQYEIDLTEVHAKQLHDALLPYLEVARTVRGGKTPRGTAAAKPDPERSRAVRVWARANGYEVADRGRISEKVLILFNAAH